MNHTEIINYLIEKNNYNNNLEVGTRYPSDNFDLIKCPNKDNI